MKQPSKNTKTYHISFGDFSVPATNSNVQSDNSPTIKNQYVICYRYCNDDYIVGIMNINKLFSIKKAKRFCDVLNKNSQCYSYWYELMPNEHGLCI